MSQRRLLLEDDEEDLPVRPARKPLDPQACSPCKGSGWGSFFPGGGRICEKCGGSGRRPNKQKE